MRSLWYQISRSERLSCDTANATRGHHAVSRVVFDAAKILDPSGELEAIGLILGTRLRPADVLITAVGSAQTALDIGITSPDSSHAGADAAASMYEHKVNRYSPHEHPPKADGANRTSDGLR